MKNYRHGFHRAVVRFMSVCLAALASICHAASYYPVRLEDPRAVYLDPAQFGIKADGVFDCSEAIQKAIDTVQEKYNQGIVFVPEGRYRITRTIYIWPAIRLIGYGKNRPVFVLAPNTPGYQDPHNPAYMIHFTGSRPRPGQTGRGGPGMPAAPGPQAPGRGAAATGRPPDAGAGTFYSAMSNIDIEIGDGNPGAVGVRGTYAQHSFLAHMDFRIGSGYAGVHDTGNVMEGVRFFGGRYGIITRTPSPSWQFTAVDVYFEGQREAAIRETDQVGLTLIRPHFRKVPVAITVDPNRPEQLWIKDGRFEEISGPAVQISMENSPRTQINMENVVCRQVPVFALLRESGKKFAAPAEIYEVRVFSHGLHFAQISPHGETRSIFDAVALKQMPAPVPSDLLPLPPAETWVNIRSLGARGDGTTDDTEVFRKAIAQHRAIYIPSGFYVISDTLTLRPDTVLIGLHPSTTQILLLDRTPAFQGVGAPKPMIEAPRGGTNIMIGIGVYTNGINPRAVAVKWMAGKDSLMNDVRFLGGHGTNRPDGTRENPYNNNRTADPDINRRWDGQYPSLWITNGGGGTFFDIWTPSSFAQSGILISDTKTEGRIYHMSAEHHVRYEVQIHRAANWRIYAMQTEGERGESGFDLPIEIVDSSDITFANLFIYRVISSYQPFPWAIKVSGSRNIHFRNVHCYSNSKVNFDAAIYDETNKAELRQREFAWLTLTGAAPKPAGRKPSALVAPGARVEKLASGFFNAAGGAVSPEGDYYFVDAYRQRIYRWSVSSGQLSIVRDAPLDPINLAFDKAGHLLVVSYSGNGTVFSFKPGAPLDEFRLLEGVPAEPRPGLTPVLPLGDWRVRVDPKGGLGPKRTVHYISPDGTTYLAAGQDFATGAMSWGVKSADVLRSFGLGPAQPGQPFYYTGEADIATWRATVGPDGNFTDYQLFVYQGGESVTTDASGRVYIANGHIYVYSPEGKLIDTLETPERPTHIAFGGKDRRTLFILTRNALYSLRMRVAGN